MDRKAWSWLAFSIIYAGSMLACNTDARSPARKPYTSDAVYQVAKVFTDFYQRLGGEEFLGPCLTAGFDKDGKTYQYTSTVLMVYDPSAPEARRRHLAALGNVLKIDEPPQLQTGGVVIRGYRIWEEVLPIYERYGREIIGLPLTNLRYNAERRRYEQLFENIGFYRFEDDPTSSIHLLAYGAMVCGSYCSYQSSSNTIAVPTVLPPSPAELLDAERVIGETAARLGAQLTGRAITPVYRAVDGMIEQVFENLVFVIDLENPGRASVRSLRDALGLRPAPLATLDPKDYFYLVEGEWGYNIPPYFMDFITQHGGIEISGFPITQEYNVNDRVTRQCFTNLCLEFHRAAPEMLRIRPQPIGYIYRDLNYRPDPASTSEVVQQVSDLKIWEASPLLSQQRQQVIWAAVYENSIPISGIEMRLFLTLPDGTQQTFAMPLTDEQGLSSVTLPLISGANSTIVPYQVCVISAAIDKLCEEENFVLWDDSP